MYLLLMIHSHSLLFCIIRRIVIGQDNVGRVWKIDINNANNWKVSSPTLSRNS